MADRLNASTDRDDRREVRTILAMSAAAMALIAVALAAASGPGLLVVSLTAASGVIVWATGRIQRRWSEAPVAFCEEQARLVARRIAELEMFRRGLQALPWLGAFVSLTMLLAGLMLMAAEGPDPVTVMVALMAPGVAWIFRTEARAGDRWARQLLERLRIKQMRLARSEDRDASDCYSGRTK